MVQDGAAGVLFWGREAPPLREHGGRLPVALVFPETEDAALATLGWQVVYRSLWSEAVFAVERFCLGPDREPRNLDSSRPLADFPLICFSLNFEGDLVVALAMLVHQGIPCRATDRSDWPLVMAGGPLAFLNPFPLAPGLDFAFVGEAENGFRQLAKHLAGVWLQGGSREQALEAVHNLPGVLMPNTATHSSPVQRRIAPGPPGLLDAPAYSSFVTSRSRFPDMLLLEVNRGCPYGCRFCAAGCIYRPPRQARMQDLQEIVQAANPTRVGLVGTALTDWPHLQNFLAWLHKRKTGFSLSSLRADTLTRPFLEFLRRCGTRSITLSLEGTSPRLRQAMNKNLNEERFLQAVAWAGELKFNHLKIYLILGWPDEGPEDLDQLNLFLHQIQKARHEGRGVRRQGLERVTISASFLVPKPWTPMQWAPMADMKKMKSLFAALKRMTAKHKGMRCSGENPMQARVQGLLARGDERLFPLLEAAVAGESWKNILKREDALTADILDRQRADHEIFPWERLDMGVSRDFLLREWQAFFSGRKTPPCPESGCPSCRRCGMENHMPTFP